MRRPTTPALAAGAAALALALSACGTSATSDGGPSPVPAASSPAASSPAAPTTSTAAGSSPTAATSGAYITLAEYDKDPAARAGTKVVLFFHAPWCPSCRATEAAIGTSGVPDGLTLVKVDYDSETALRQQYGVTYQHTFVQVDAQGRELAKWTGSADGADILARTV